MTNSGEMRLGRIEQGEACEFSVITNSDLVDFSRVQAAGYDTVGNPMSSVMWEDGRVAEAVLSDTPVFIVRHKERIVPDIVLPLDRADHIQQLHLLSSESGSFFTPIIHDPYTTEAVTLDMLIEHVAKNLSVHALQGNWERRTLEFSSGIIPGREGVMSATELKKWVPEDLYYMFLRQRSRIMHANLTQNIDEMHATVERINLELEEVGESPLTVQLVREAEGGVIVPHLSMIPRHTSKMMVELGVGPGAHEVYIHTIAPGRRMPRHPIPRLYGDDTQALRHAAHTWALHVQVEAPLEEPPYFQRTLDLLQSSSFRSRYLFIRTETERNVLDQIEAEAGPRAVRRAKDEVKEIAALGIGLTVADAKKMKREWQQILNERRKAPIEGFTDGIPLQEYLTDYHVNKVLSSEDYPDRIEEAEATLATALEEAEAELEGFLAELTARRDDPLLVQALKAWSSTPDSRGDRAHDGLGYNGGLIHFFEYRASRRKRRRFEIIDEPPTVDGFIAFTTRLVEALDAVFDYNVDQLVDVTRDAEGNRRYYILLPGKKGEFIVAFQKAGEPRPLLTAMFNKATPGSFRNMRMSVLAGQDRGQINRLGPGILPVYLRISQVSKK